VINLDHKAFFWREFDENEKPIQPKECQLIFNFHDGGEVRFLLNIDEEYDEQKYSKNIPKLYGLIKSAENKISKSFTIVDLKLIEPPLWQLNSGLELTELRYSIEYIFLGSWLKNENSLDIMHIRYSYLELFLNQLTTKQPQRIDNKTVAGMMVEKETIKSISEDYNVLFNIDNALNQTTINNKIVTYEVKNHLAIAKKENFQIGDAINLSIVVKNFFEIITFYSQNQIFIEEFKVSQKDDVITVLFKQNNYVEEKQISHLDFLFKYEDIKENFVQILNNWINHHHKNENEFSSFCNVISDKNTKFNVYSHFFQLISALEGYHRKNSTLDKEFLQKQKMYAKRLDYKKTSSLDKKKIKNFITKLENKNEPSFRIRLKELIELSDIKSIIKLSSSIHKSISNLIYNTRNDIAHSNKNIILTDKMQYVYEYLKLVSLLIMIKDISLNHSNFSKHIFDFEFNDLKDNLEKAFEKNIQQNNSRVYK